MAQFTHTNILTTAIKLLKKHLHQLSSPPYSLKRPIAIRDKQPYTQTKRWGKYLPHLSIHIFQSIFRFTAATFRKADSKPRQLFYTQPYPRQCSSL